MNKNACEMSSSNLGYCDNTWPINTHELTLVHWQNYASLFVVLYKYIAGDHFNTVAVISPQKLTGHLYTRSWYMVHISQL